MTSMEDEREAVAEAPALARTILIRPSNDADVPAMLAIYLQHIAKGVGDIGTFPSQPLEAEDLKRRRKNMRNHRLPHLVAEVEGAIAGYAYAVPFRKRPAYRYTVKNSIYVHPDHLNAGVGRRLLPALIDACTAAGCRQMIAYIDVVNEPSRRLHETFGFEQAGVLKAVGFKYGRWTDSILMQRELGPGGMEPPDDGGGKAVAKTGRNGG